MTITIDTDNPRTVKAIELAADAGQWVKCKTADGRKMYGIRASKSDSLHYLVTCEACSCEDFKRRGLPCKHILAVRLHVGLSQAVQPMRRMPVSTRED